MAYLTLEPLDNNQSPQGFLSSTEEPDAGGFMSVWQSASPAPHLYGRRGELISVSVNAKARDLESILEALSSVEFPINPQIIHSDGFSNTIVRFPAYSEELPCVYSALEVFGFPRDHVQVNAALEPVAGMV